MPYVVKQRHRAPALPSGLEADDALPRVCIIGAGSSGLAAAKALYEASIPFECYERGTVVGGNWVYDNPNGVSACYESLEINTSCPRMAFSDFPMPSDYPQYARHDQVAAYFEHYVDHFGFRDRLTFETTVERVGRGTDGGWTVEVAGPSGRRSEDFDAVIVANGHHWDARWPDPPYPGDFEGEQIHSHDFRSADQLEGRDVVVVGSGNSAMDIAVAAGQRARNAVISQRRGEWVLRKYILGLASDRIALPGWMPWWATSLRLWIGAKTSGSTAKLGLPKPRHRPGQSHPVQSEGIRAALRSGEVTAKPGIERLTKSGVEFVDGSSVPADLIVWATGYRVTFPFLDEALISAHDNDLPLWKRTVHPDLPGLFFVGLLQPVGAVMPLAEAQSVWITEILRGTYAPPDDAEIRRQMTDDHQRQQERFYRSARHTMEVDFDHFLWDLDRERRRGARRAADPAARRSQLAGMGA